MSFNLLTVRDGDAAEDALYPAPGEDADSVELREDDGQPSPPLPVSDLSCMRYRPVAAPSGYCA